VGVQERGGPGQGARDEPVVGGEQGHVVAVGPLEEAFVVRGDVALVGLVDVDLDPRIGGGQLAGDVRRVVGRGVVDDEHPEVDAGVLVQDAAHAVGEEMAVLEARDDNTDAAHRWG